MNTEEDRERDRQRWHAAMKERQELIQLLRRAGVKFKEDPNRMKMDRLRQLRDDLRHRH